MIFYHILILALVQGVTEFLPISSSGHLVLVHAMMGQGGADLCWEQNRLMDVAVHVGTLLSVLVYFRRDIFSMLSGMFQKGFGAGKRLALYIVIASLPVIVAGFVLHILQPSFICLVTVMAWMTILFGIILYFADKMPNQKTVEELSWRSALMIGLAQVLALIPGVSRSGVTMTAARFLGFSRVESARFSLLLAIVAISGAGFLSALDLFESGTLVVGADVGLAVLLSFAAGYAAIVLMMGWLSRSSFMPFVVYRVALGVVLLGLIYGGVL